MANTAPKRQKEVWDLPAAAPSSEENHGYRERLYLLFTHPMRSGHEQLIVWKERNEEVILVSFPLTWKRFETQTTLSEYF